MTSSKKTAIDTTLELSGTDIAALRYIVEYQKSNPFHRPPSHRELMDHLNKILPKRSHGGPALTSTIQTLRIASRLRTKGYLLQVDENDVVKSRNLVATPTGERFLRHHFEPLKSSHH